MFSQSQLSGPQNRCSCFWSIDREATVNYFNLGVDVFIGDNDQVVDIDDEQDIHDQQSETAA